MCVLCVAMPDMSREGSIGAGVKGPKEEGVEGSRVMDKGEGWGSWDLARGGGERRFGGWVLVSHVGFCPLSHVRLGHVFGVAGYVRDTSRWVGR